MAEHSGIECGEIVTLTEDDIRKLKDGERITMIDSGEYVIIVELKS